MKKQLPTIEEIFPKRPMRLRAWDNKLKMMHYDIQIYGVYQPVLEEDEELSFEDFILMKDRFHVMQDTNKVDLKEKTIYEGDIVEAHEKGKNYPLRYLIVYNENKSSLTMRWEGRLKELSGFYDDPIRLNIYDQFDVIGNIYQNRELLRET